MLSLLRWWLFLYQIRLDFLGFSNVDFKYETTKDRAIKNINLEIEGGKITALVGQSGAGKSTIINLIPIDIWFSYILGYQY